MAVLGTGKPARREAYIKARGKGERFAFLDASPFKDNDGNVRQIVEIVIDVTERKRARPHSLKDRKIYISAGIGISIYPRDGGDMESLLKAADAA